MGRVCQRGIFSFIFSFTPINAGFILIFILSFAAILVPAKGKDKDVAQYGAGLIVNVPFPESEVVKVIQDVVQNGIIRGTKEYNKDEYVSGAVSASSTPVFKDKDGTEGGQVFYKVRERAIDPRNFKDGSDVGTLAVRYIVQAQGEKNTVIRIDARFVEEFRKVVHASNGSVEGAEYKDIHDRLDAIELMKTQTAEDVKEKQYQEESKQRVALVDATPAAPTVAPAVPANSGSAAVPVETTPVPPVQTLQEHVAELRRQVERKVKAPGAPLKSAPFHTASVLQSLPAGAEVLIVISTTYWLGVETHDGAHGWMLRDELEFVP
jgi:hypothetical protein